MWAGGRALPGSTVGIRYGSSLLAKQGKDRTSGLLPCSMLMNAPVGPLDDVASAALYLEAGRCQLS